MSSPALPLAGWYLTQLSTMIYVPFFACMAGTGITQQARFVLQRGVVGVAGFRCGRSRNGDTLDQHCQKGENGTVCWMLLGCCCWMFFFFFFGGVVRRQEMQEMMAYPNPLFGRILGQPHFLQMGRGIIYCNYSKKWPSNTSHQC